MPMSVVGECAFSWRLPCVSVAGEHFEGNGGVTGGHEFAGNGSQDSSKAWAGASRPGAPGARQATGRCNGHGPGAGLPVANGWGNVGGNWAQSVSTDAATFEAWIRTASKASQTIVIGSNPPGAAPRISVGGDQLSVYWSTAGAAPGWTSADTTPVTDGQWHHIAVVFDGGAITFYKDGVATADRLTVSGVQQAAAGTFQLGAGFGSVTGFVGELYDVRVWSVARSAQQIAAWRWAPMSLSEPGLTARTSSTPPRRRSSTRSVAPPARSPRAR